MTKMHLFLTIDVIKKGEKKKKTRDSTSSVIARELFKYEKRPFKANKM